MLAWADTHQLFTPTPTQPHTHTLRSHRRYAPNFGMQFVDLTQGTAGRNEYALVPVITLSIGDTSATLATKRLLPSSLQGPSTRHTWSCRGEQHSRRTSCISASASVSRTVISPNVHATIARFGARQFDLITSGDKFGTGRRSRKMMPVLQGLVHAVMVTRFCLLARVHLPCVSICIGRVARSCAQSWQSTQALMQLRSTADIAANAAVFPCQSSPTCTPPFHHVML